MKTIVLGDTHGRDTWKKIVADHPDAERIIFIGDYFDSFDIDYIEQIKNYQDIIAYKESGEKEVIMLIGNHDYYYFREINSDEISGYNHRAAVLIRPLLDQTRHHLQMCYIMDNFLFSHAGVSPEWLDDTFPEWRDKEMWPDSTLDDLINDIWKHKPLKFMFNGSNPYGDDTYQTPIWIRPGSLELANREEYLKEKYIQIVGHTRIKSISAQTHDTGYYFIDCLDANPQEYLIIQDGVVSVGKVNLTK